MKRFISSTLIMTLIVVGIPLFAASKTPKPKKTNITYGVNGLVSYYGFALENTPKGKGVLEFLTQDPTRILSLNTNVRDGWLLVKIEGVFDGDNVHDATWTVYDNPNHDVNCIYKGDVSFSFLDKFRASFTLKKEGLLSVKNKSYPLIESSKVNLDFQRNTWEGSIVINNSHGFDGNDHASAIKNILDFVGESNLEKCVIEYPNDYTFGIGAGIKKKAPESFTISSDRFVVKYKAPNSYWIKEQGSEDYYTNTGVLSFKKTFKDYSISYKGVEYDSRFSDLLNKYEYIATRKIKNRDKWVVVKLLNGDVFWGTVYNKGKILNNNIGEISALPSNWTTQMINYGCYKTSSGERFLIFDGKKISGDEIDKVFVARKEQERSKAAAAEIEKQRRIAQENQEAEARKKAAEEAAELERQRQIEREQQREQERQADINKWGKYVTMAENGEHPIGMPYECFVKYFEFKLWDGIGNTSFRVMSESTSTIVLRVYSFQQLISKATFTNGKLSYWYNY